MPKFGESYYIKKILNFTNDDFVSHRKGYITDQNLKRLKTVRGKRIRQHIREILLYTTFAILFMMFVPNQMLAVRILMFPLILPLFLIPTAINNLIWSIQNQKIFSGKIVSQTGIIRTHDTILNFASESSTIQLNTDGEIFRVPSGLMYHLDIGKVYTIYYLQGTKTVVSIYKVDAQTSVRVIKDELKYLESLETDLKAKNKAKTSSR